MSRKYFSWLLGATLLVGVLVVMLPSRTSKESEFEARELFPDLTERVNQLDRVQVSGAGNKPIATLVRSDAGWSVAELHDYPADWPALRDLLAALAKARLVEAKTSNPEYFSRLGVSDIDAEDSAATLLQLGNEEDGMALLVGNPAEGRDGQYVRLAGADQAWLIDQQLNLPGEARDWLNREIVNIADAEVVEFSVAHSDGEAFSASKVSADDEDFNLKDLPEGRELLSAWSLNNMASALSSLELDEVSPVDSIDFADAATFSLMTADGLQVEVQLAESEEQSWIKLVATAYETESMAMDRELAALAAAETPENKADSDTEAASDGEDDPAADTGDRAREINQRVGNWAYSIPTFKASVMNKRLEDVLKPLAESE